MKTLQLVVLGFLADLLCLFIGGHTMHYLSVYEVPPWIEHWQFDILMVLIGVTILVGVGALAGWVRRVWLKGEPAIQDLKFYLAGFSLLFACSLLMLLIIGRNPFDPTLFIVILIWAVVAALNAAGFYFTSFGKNPFPSK